MYRMVDTALVRAAPHTVGLEPQSWPDLAGDTAEDVDRWLGWIKQVWSRESVALAVEVASPLFAGRVQAVLDGRVCQPRQVRRVAATLVRYLLRVQHRATPFGLFAGVAPARFDRDVVVRWGAEHRTRAGADAAWLADIVAELEACPELVRRLPVMVDSTCVVRGGRVVVPCQQPRSDGSDGPAEISVRHTPAMDKVLHTARAPVPFRDLVREIAVDYPQAPAVLIDRMLGELVARRVLLTGLRPPMTATDPLGHVVAHLCAANAASIPELATIARELTGIHRGLADHNHATPQAQQPILRAVQRQMTNLRPGIAATTTVDLHLDCDLSLSMAVAREAEKALEVMVRLTPFPFGPPAWRDYHNRFLERYGLGAIVPLPDLVDPDIGLGFPAGYRGSLWDRPPSRPTTRDEHLLAVAQRAALDGAREIVLDGQLLADLAVEGATTVPAHVELCFHLHAPSRPALAHGSFDLVVDGLSQAAGTMTGRFLDLLSPADRDRITATYAGLPAQDAGATRAQLSSPPLRVRTENVSRVAAVLPKVISVGEHRPPRGALSLGELAVGADTRRLFLISQADGRRIEPAVLNAVELTHVTHPLARFLTEISRSGSAALIPFDWGAAATMPFLPRVRSGRTILSPARWRLTANDLAPPDASWAVWADSVARCRVRYRLPEAVLLGSADQRLRLNLTERTHLQLLRADLDRWGQVTMHEAPDPADHGWFDGHAHEITVAFAADHPRSRSKPRPVHSPAVVRRDHGLLPAGSAWAFVKLYGHPDRAATILTRYLPTLFDTWDDPPACWFVRYRDPDPHLRLRFRLTQPDDFAHVARRVATWAAHLRDAGLLARIQWDTYLPETGRYGAGPAMAAAETVFVADSAAALTQLRHAGPDLASLTVVVASSVDLVISFTGDVDHAMRWLRGQVPKSTGPVLDRAIRHQTLRLADPRGDFAQLRAVPGGTQILDSWTPRRQALTDYGDRLRADGGPDPSAVLNALLHMHHIRMNGLDEPAEQECRRLARAAALAWSARNRP